MPDAYRVCIIVPPGYRHSLCFTEVGFLLKHSLNFIGRPCDLAINDLAKDRINILLGWHLMRYDEALASVRYIPYQLEQLSEKVWNGFPDLCKKMLRSAYTVWDYSEENRAFLACRGIAARLVPVGYHESLEQVPAGREKDIDVLFYGSMCDRRRAVLDCLSRDRGVRVESLFNVYGRERDDYIARSWIIINIHFYPSLILESIRISYLLNNRCFVVSEVSPVNPYGRVNIPLVPYEDLAETCRTFLKKKDDIERRGGRSYEEFKRNYPMVEFVKNALA